MKSPFPQSNLPQNTGGGRDVWNIRNAGVILHDLFFGLPKFETLTDDFNDNSIDTAKWINWGGAEVVETSARLEVTVLSGGGNYQGIESVEYYSLVNSFASISLLNAGNQALTSLEVSFGLLKDTDYKVFFLVSGNNLIAYRKIAGTNQYITQISYNSTTQKFLRFIELRGVLYWQYSADGVTWSTLHSEEPLFSLGALKIEMVAGVYASEATSTLIVWDNFNVFSSVTPVVITKSLIYRILTRTALIKSMRYVVRLITSPTKALTYRILLRTAITKSLRYVIRTVGVPITKSVTYRIRTVLSVTKSLRYVIAVEAGITKSVRYAVLTKLAITKGITYRIQTVATAITKALAYRILLRTAITKSLRYVVRVPTAITKSLAYRIRTSVAITKSLQYVVTIGTSTSAITKALAYRIKTVLTITKSMHYVVRFLGAITKSTTYRIRTRIAITRAIQYRIRLVGPLSKSAQYGIKRVYSITKALQYVIVVLTVGAINKALRYTILTRTAITKGLTYDVFAVMRSAITKSMRYEIQRIFPFTESPSPFTKMASPLTERTNVFTPAVKPFSESPSPFRRFNP